MIRNMMPFTATIRTGGPTQITTACRNPHRTVSQTPSQTLISPPQNPSSTLCRKNEALGKAMMMMMRMMTIAAFIMPRGPGAARNFTLQSHTRRKNPGGGQQVGRHGVNSCALMNFWNRSEYHRLGSSGISFIHRRIRGSLSRTRESHESGSRSR